MGDELDGSSRVVTLESPTGSPASSASTEPQDAPSGEGRSSAAFDRGRRRFTIAVVAGVILGALPVFWVMWDLWGAPNPVQNFIFENNYYDLQTRAMFSGHLWLANGSIGIEAFVHGGHQYTYFGLFPSLIRMPILAVTHGLDGKLTVPSMATAWLVTGLFTSLLLWRVRVLIRGRAIVGWTEALGFGALSAAIMGGSVLVLLSATHDVFTEDLAWSVGLTVGCLFCLLGVLERPSWGRVIASFVLIMAASLDRATTGWACVGAACAIGVWFGLGRGGRHNRRWCVPLLAAGLVALVVGAAANYAKFGIPFGVSTADQVYTHVNTYRRRFLAANHNSETGAAFIPSNALAYFRPDGIRLTSVFPFITLPSSPAAAVAGVLFDRRYRTASLPASMPLLFLLSCWGLVTAFRPKPIGRVALTRIPLVASGLAGGVLLAWGYIAPRYLADFMPFLVLAAAVALVDVWRRLAHAARTTRLAALSVVLVLALFSMAANFGMAATPNEQWSGIQTYNFVQFQKSISDQTGHPLNSHVVRGTTLPPWGPAGELFVVGDCSGLYVSNGEDYSTAPAQQFVRTTWMVVERGHAFEHTFRLTFTTPAGGAAESVPLVTVGASAVKATVQSTGTPGRLQVVFGLYGQVPQVLGRPAQVSPGSTHQVVVVTDPAKHQVEVTLDGAAHLFTTLSGSGPVLAARTSQSPGSPPAITAVNVTDSAPQPKLCKSLVH